MASDNDKVDIGRKRMIEWLAFDIYPEYVMDAEETVKFLADLRDKYPAELFDAWKAQE